MDLLDIEEIDITLFESNSNINVGKLIIIKRNFIFQ